MYKISLKNIDVHREYEHGDTSNKFVVAFQTGKGHNDALLQRMVLGRHLREENAAWQKYDEFKSKMHFNEQNFIGWPDTSLMEMMGNCIKGPRGHPLEEGHRKIADVIFSSLQDCY